MDQTVKYITNSLLQYLGSIQSINKQLSNGAREFVEKRLPDALKDNEKLPLVTVIRNIIISYFADVYTKQLTEIFESNIVDGIGVDTNTVQWESAAKEQPPRIESDEVKRALMLRQCQQTLLNQGAYRYFIIDVAEIGWVTDSFINIYKGTDEDSSCDFEKKCKDDIFIYTIAHLKRLGYNHTRLLHGGYIRVRDLTLDHVRLYTQLFVSYPTVPRTLVDDIEKKMHVLVCFIHKYLQGKRKQEGKANGTYEIEYLKTNIFKKIVELCGASIPEGVTIDVDKLKHA